MPELRLFGPVELLVCGQVVDLGPPKRRTVFAALAVDAGRPVPVDTLVDRVWNDAPPAEARNTLYAHIVRIRRALAESGGANGIPVRLKRRAGGYLLDVDPGQVDLHRFRHLTEQARQPEQDDARRGALLRDALALCRGTPLAGLSGAWVQRVREGCRQQRLDAVVAWARVELRLGNYHAVTDQVHRELSEYPLVEPLTETLMRALYAAGRTAEALDCYTAIRQRLVDALGVGPGPALQELHQAILRGDTYQVAAPTRPHEPTVPAQLPADVRGFTGRDIEILQLDRILDTAEQQPTSVVISAVSGTAGVGKTALAVHWAYRVIDRFPDGHLYVNLRGFDTVGSPVSPAEAVRGFLDAFAVPPERVPANLDGQVGLYRSLLSRRRVLILLDNARDADHVRPLLPGAPGCLALVTSRNQLSGLVAGEGAHLLTLDLLTADESRQLLAWRLGVDRVAAEPEAVDEITALCARLPLALAIVAARAAAHAGFSLDALAAELRDARGSLDAFGGGELVTDVRAVFSWSYRTLSSDSARLFRQLGQHRGPDINLPAAASLAGIPVQQTRSLLAELTRAHMAAEHSPGRYTLHDLLRTYATEQAQALDAPVERDSAVLRLLDHYLHTAHLADRLLDPHRDAITLGRRQPGVTPEVPAGSAQALAWFTAEQPAIIAAIRQAVETGLDVHACELAWALVTFFDRQGHWHDLVTTQCAALEAARSLVDGARQAFAHRYLGRAYTRLGQYDEAHAHLSSALRLYVELGDCAGQAHIHRGLSWVSEGKGLMPEALDNSERALKLFRTTGHRAGQADSLNAVGWYHALLGEYQLAITYCEEALTLLRELEDRYGQAATLDSLGYAYHHLGRYELAASCYDTALELLRETGDRHHEAEVLVHLGTTHRAARDHDAAGHAWRGALSIFDQLGHAGAEQVRAQLVDLEHDCAKASGKTRHSGARE
ncbi:BTAD domain-containing putative transcriptional regulator [Plantactinospora solaniradicis]|uniref:BTAD domain-containing putative transcriptional regulator n=1 Tax=Plantactinospora solaniradicis TaxID=1723736 RepID=A0ABW1K6B6_9ACTN